MTPREAGLTEIRARLDELGQRRLSSNFEAADRVEYRLLARREAELLLRASTVAEERAKPPYVQEGFVEW